MSIKYILFLSVTLGFLSEGSSQVSGNLPVGDQRHFGVPLYPTLKGKGITAPSGSREGSSPLTKQGGKRPLVNVSSIPPLTLPRADFAHAANFVVYTTADTGEGSLRKAIADANSNPGADIITFAIPGSGVQSIRPLSALPDIAGPVLIDGTSQPGYSGSPLIELDGSQAGVGVNGLTIRAGGSAVQGLAINRFIGVGDVNGHGILLEGAGGNILEGNFIGTDATGSFPLGNGGSGIVIHGASQGNRIGAMTTWGRNVISGNLGSGIQFSTGSGGRNLVQGNLIGTDATGRIALGNQGNGVFMDAQHDTIGGSIPGAGNLISGNVYPGVYLGASARWTEIQGNYIGTTLSGDSACGNEGNGVMVDGASDTRIEGNVASGNSSTAIYIMGASATRNTLIGNWIGTNVGGTAAIANSSNGIVIDNAPGNSIGYPSDGGGNLVSGNGGAGIYISGIGAAGNTVRANLVGTNSAGADTIPNAGYGIIVETSPGNIIGGPTPAYRNVVSGNRAGGMIIRGAGASGNTTQGNFIGTDQSGYVPLPNAGAGIVVDNAPNNTIGGTGHGANVVSGNTLTGIAIINPGASGNRIIGNYIGVDASGIAAMPNAKGVLINNAPDNFVGGALAEEGNTISGNILSGIEIRNSQATRNSVRGNFIGTLPNDYIPMGNGSHGVLLIAARNRIGGPDRLDGNRIAYNGGAGVYDSVNAGNLVRLNSIVDNGGLGIDISPHGFSKNDSLDADGRQNFPLLDSASVVHDSTTLFGRLESRPNETFTLDFYTNATYDPTHFGEGGEYLGTALVATNDSGRGKIKSSFPIAVPTNKYITATATDTAGRTSEFSQALCLSDLDGDGIMDSWETEGWGMDVNSDGIVDLDLYSMGARPDHKDIFVEADAMDLSGGISMGPLQSSLDTVMLAFAAAANRFVNNPDGRDGIELHIVYQDHKHIPRTTWYVDPWQQFFDVRNQYFGTYAERTSSNWTNIRQAKNLVFRYCVFADDFDNAGHSSGWSDGIVGNNFMVTLGQWRTPGGRERQKTGTFMHELGHSLGLRHGGGDDFNYKPNYISIMNYAWQNPLSKWMPPKAWDLRYSTFALPTLDEAHLNEPSGLSPLRDVPVLPVPFRDAMGRIHWARLVPGAAVDWDGNRDSTAATGDDVRADICRLDVSAPYNVIKVLQGFEDWSHLAFNFRSSPTFSTDAPKGVPGDVDMTLDTYEMLENLPPPKPYGRFSMDGVLDSSAVLLSSNGGIDLYAAVRGGQVYVAANPAATQGGDMVIYVAIPPGSLKQAPLNKTGQAAGWSAYLVNRSSDNSRGWFDDTGAPLTCITLDTVGSILEGVIDFELLLGRSPDSVYVAVGKYEPGDGGTLLMQSPAGNEDENIDPAEFVSLCTPSALSMRWQQQGDKLVGSGAMTGSALGSAVAISADGNTAVDIAMGNTGYGSVWVFTRSNGTWSQQGSKLSLSGASYDASPQAVSISADGNTFIVGAPYDNAALGAAWVFTRTGGVWSQQGGKLVGTGVVSSYGAIANQGCSVALSGSGDTALVGGQADADGVGAVWTFVRVNGVWSQLGNKLVASGAIGKANQGRAVALSSDGRTAAVGGLGDNGSVGAVWIFTRTGGAWMQQAKLAGVKSGCFGMSVALSGNGDRVVVGAPMEDSQIGRAYILSRSGGVWSQEGGPLRGFDAGGPLVSLGWAVTISGDGNRVAVGGQYDAGTAGAVWAFVRADGIWKQDGAKLVGSGGTTNAQQGFSVALSSDGCTLITGGWHDNATTGAVWIFTRPGGPAFSMSSFGARYLAGAGVRLDWTAVSVVGSYGFTVQRRLEHETDFSDMPNGRISGFAPPGVPQAYSCLDTSSQSGTRAYRVRALDISGVVMYTDPITVDLMGVGRDDGLPHEFALQQNYPNPWNPSTVIGFAMPQRAHVTLAVYNLLGQRVALLTEGWREAGYHKLVFRQNGLASGVYFYRIVAGKFVQTKKMMLLK